MTAAISHATGPRARVFDGARCVAEWALDARQVRTPAREAATLRQIERSIAE